MEKVSNQPGNLSLQGKVDALRARIEAQKREVEESKKQTKEELVAEIADSIMGHQKMASNYEKASQDTDWSKRPGYGYGEIQRNEWTKIDTERQSISTKQQELELLKTQVTELENETGSEAVAEFKQELEDGFADIEKRKIALTQKEKQFKSLEGTERYNKYEQDELAKDIPKFALENIIKVHKEFDGVDYSVDADELLKSALVEVGARRTAEWQKQNYEKEEKIMDEISDKIHAQERKLAEAEPTLNQLSTELENNYRAQEKAIEESSGRADLGELKREYAKKKNDDGFFTKSRSQKRATEIKALFEQMKMDLFKDIPFDNREFDNRVLSELGWKYNCGDSYENRDTNLRFIHFYENEVPKNHPRSQEMQDAHTRIIERTKEILKRMNKLQTDSRERWSKVTSALNKVFELPK